MLSPSRLVPLSLAFVLLACGSSSEFKGNVNQEKQRLAPSEPPAPPQAPDPTPSEIAPVVPEVLSAVSDLSRVSLKVDIVFAIDTSGSMVAETNSVQRNLARMIAALTNGRLDPRVHLMLDPLFNLPTTIDATKVAFVQRMIGSYDAIGHLNKLFAGTYNRNYRTITGQAMAAPLAFRGDAKLEIVVVSDDNGQSIGNRAVDFDPAKRSTSTFNAIVGLANSPRTETCNVVNIGTEYLTLSAASKGTVLDICSPDWTTIIDRLSADIIKRSVSFALSREPAVPAELEVYLDKQLLAKDAWTYDATTRTVTLVQTSQVRDGSEVQVNYNSRN